MRKEFESGLARSITGQKKERKMLGKAWITLALGAVLLAGSALAVAAMQNQGATAPGDQIQDRLQDGTCEDVTVPDSDGVSDCICDCTCDCDCDCTNPDCPCCDDAL
jgi:hypothetical protein